MELFWNEHSALSLRISRQCSLHHLYVLSGNQRISRIDEYLVVWREAGDDFYLIPKIVPWSNVGYNGVSVFHHTHLQLLASKDQGADWKQEGRIPCRNFQVNLRIRSGEQRAAGIIEVNLRQQRSRTGVNRIGRAYELSGKSLAGKFGEGDVCHGFDRLYALRIFFGHVHIDTQGARLRDVKQIC